MERPIVESVGGVMDTLDGSHGPSFTYLPVAYQDDCQVASSHTQYVKDDRTFYRLTLRFMVSEWQGEPVLANNETQRTKPAQATELRR